MSESLDTEQASIVFMGRESFRMKVVGTPAGATNVGAIPSAIWEGPTARLVERRNSDRRSRERRNSERRDAIVVAPPQGEPVELPGAEAAPARNTIIGVALTTFACGLLVATGVARIGGHRDSDAPTSTQHAQAVTPPALQATPAALPTPPQPETPPAVQPPARAAAVVVQQLPAAEPAPQPAAEPASAPPALDPRPEKQRAVVTAPVARAATSAPVTRARRPAHTPHPASTLGTDPDPFAPAAAKPGTASKKWVDPFAE